MIKMEKLKDTKILGFRLLLALALVLSLFGTAAVQTASAAEFFLRAEVTSVTMPDTGEVVTMWGFANDTSFGTMDGVVTVPGPALRMPVGDTTLTIHLDNNLPEDISLQIPGLVLNGVATAPVKVDTDGTGRLRARSLTKETAAGNALAETYTWNNVRPGTHMYMSATNPAKQVQMGLYGAVIKDFALGEAYPGAIYNAEVLLFFSEIDPAIHAAVAADDYGTGKTITSSLRYDAKYFLINGAPFPSASSVVKAGNSGQTTLIRFLNASLETHMPLLQGMYMKWVAEDGWQLPFPLERYALILPAGKTLDAVVGIAPNSGGKYPLYDRRLNLTNNAIAGGGMLAYLGVDMRLLTVVKAGLGSGTVTSVPAGIDCGSKCAELYDNTVNSVVLNAVADIGSTFTGWSGGGCAGTAPCTVDLTGGDQTITATFVGIYSISGTVRTASGVPLSGVTINLAGTASGSTSTDGAGNYGFVGLASGSYTITPALAGYSFLPSSRSIAIGGASVGGQNFTASSPTAIYSISGRVTDALGGPLSMVTMTLTGDASRTVTTSVLGSYSFTNLANGNYTVTPSKAGIAAFTPASISDTIAGANITGVDFEGGTSTATFFISGSVRTATGVPISGVTVALSGTASASATTDARGFYRFTGLSNGPYDLTPSLTGYEFSPISLSPTIADASSPGQDFTGTPVVGPVGVRVSVQPGVSSVGSSGSVDAAENTYAVSGRVTAKGGAPIEGATVTLGGDSDMTATTDRRGYYRLRGLKEGSYTVIPLKAGYSFDPARKEVTVDGANVKSVNFRGVK